MTQNPLTGVPLTGGLFDDLNEDDVRLSVNIMVDGKVNLRGQGPTDSETVALWLRLIADQLD